MQAIELSDLQPVASHDVCPVRTPAVCQSPRLEPAIVKLADPVDAQLSDWFIGKLTADSSIDQLSVTLPDAPSPAVTMRRLLPTADALPALHKTEVSEIQSVPSHADWPILAWPLAICNPNPDPSSVMLVDSVLAIFSTPNARSEGVIFVTLDEFVTLLVNICVSSPYSLRTAPPSTVQASGMLPACSPAVMVIVRVP